MVNLLHEAWGSDEEEEGKVEIVFDCIKAYLNSGRVEQISNELYLDPDVVLRFVQSYAEHMEFLKRKRENYNNEDPEEEVIVETLEVDTSQAPMEDDYERVRELPFPVRKAQLEYLSKEYYLLSSISRSRFLA